MSKKDVFTKTLATAGTVLVWLPILAPVLLAVTVSVRAHVSLLSHLDYLMPAELFPVALVGGGLLLWAALRTRVRRRLVAGSLAGAVILLVGSQAVAVVTGLASGRTEPTGWQWALVLALLALFVLALIAMGVGGVLLLRDFFKTARR